MLKAAIFDLNGIFIQSPKLSDRFAEVYGVPTIDFLPKLSEIMDKVRQPGAGTAFTYWEPVLKEWGVALTEEEFWDFWFRAETVSERMVAFAKELKGKGVKVFVLSNNFRERADYYGHYPWMHDVVDKTYFSWQTGFVKPDPRAWALVLEENSLDPATCIYFDDQEKNLRAAEGVGVPAHKFTTEEDLERTIVKRF